MKSDVIYSILGLVALILVMTIIIQWPEANNQNNNQYLVVFSPSTNVHESYQKIIKSGGKPIRSGFFENIILVNADDNALKELRKNNTALILSSAIIGGCFNENNSPLINMDI